MSNVWVGRWDCSRYWEFGDSFCKKLKVVTQPGLEPGAQVLHIFMDADTWGRTKGLITDQLHHGITTDSGNHGGEKELNIVMTEDTWLNVWDIQSSSTDSWTWTDFCQKTSHSWEDEEGSLLNRTMSFDPAPPIRILCGRSKTDVFLLKVLLAARTKCLLQKNAFAFVNVVN